MLVHIRRQAWVITFHSDQNPDTRTAEQVFSECAPFSLTAEVHRLNAAKEALRKDVEDLKTPPGLDGNRACRMDGLGLYVWAGCREVLVPMSRCYLIPTADGSSSIRVHAAKKPDQRSIQAIQQLFEAAHIYAAERLTTHNLNPAGIAEAAAELIEGE